MKDLIFLSSENLEDAEFASELAKTGSRKLVLLKSLPTKDLLSALNGGATVLLDANDPASIRGFNEISVSPEQAIRAHWICDPRKQDTLIPLFKEKNIFNVIYRRYNKVTEAAKAYSIIIDSTFITSPFGLKSFLGSATTVDTLKFNESIEKGFASQALSHQLLNMGYNQLIVTAIINAVDELLMNAIYDAPVDAEGNQIYAEKSRNLNVKLTGRQAVEMQIGADGGFVGISVSDLYGSLDFNEVKNCIAKSFNESKNEVRTGRLAGAGLGLSLILKRGGSLYFACKPGTRTEVTVFFRKTDRLKEFHNQFQFISLRSC